MAHSHSKLPLFFFFFFSQPKVITKIKIAQRSYHVTIQPKSKWVQNKWSGIQRPSNSNNNFFATVCAAMLHCKVKSIAILICTKGNDMQYVIAVCHACSNNDKLVMQNWWVVKYNYRFFWIVRIDKNRENSADLVLSYTIVINMNIEHLKVKY